MKAILIPTANLKAIRLEFEIGVVFAERSASVHRGGFSAASRLPSFIVMVWSLMLTCERRIGHLNANHAIVGLDVVDESREDRRDEQRGNGG